METAGTEAGAGVLYVVATPIGHLDDWSPRAVATLRDCDRLLAEDTRTTRHLLTHYGLAPARLMALHEHNEAASVASLVAALVAGEHIALVSDAGTPLISDPGFPLVRAARAAGIRVVPVPGACAAIAALSVAGLPCDRFAFEGFLPAKPAARRARLAELAAAEHTLVFYEAPHRVRETVADLAACFGNERPAALAREITKQFEHIESGTLESLACYLDADANHQRGEFVLMVAGDPEPDARRLEAASRLLDALLPVLSPRRAADLAAELSGAPRNAVYRRALEAGKGTGEAPGDPLN
jgi:16S rRNA (cytidine1402-2'-O)-methyltransferase